MLPGQRLEICFKRLLAISVAMIGQAANVNIIRPAMAGDMLVAGEHQALVAAQ